nr:CBM_HP1_G0034370.mRNA.1.CDS.1 [Saccharomyces cerevisiae]
MSVYHLPTLLNPLVNAIFNCPEPERSPLKKLFANLKTRRFILLAPPSEYLLNYHDVKSKLPLHDLCYNAEFINSYILLMTENSYINTNSRDSHYETLDGKTVVIQWKNNVIHALNGFLIRRRLKILETKILPNFNDYFEGAADFIILFIDQPLNCEFVPNDYLQCFHNYEKIPKNAHAMPNLSIDSFQQERSSFENILHIHPARLTQLGQLFSSYRTLAPGDDPSRSIFESIVQQAFDGMKSDSLFKNFSNLYDLIHDYFELNLYDDIWSRLTTHFKGHELLTDFYSKDYGEFKLHDITLIERRLHLASKHLQKLALTHSYAEKSKILVETLQKLSGTTEMDSHQLELPDGLNNMTMDADTLISLFVLVVCRSEQKHLKSHLYYLQNFSNNSSSTKFGILGYAVSTLEAVVCYFEDFNKNTGNVAKANTLCEKTKNLLDKLSCENPTNEIEDLATYKDILTYRNEQGQSILSICITNHKNYILLDILSEYENDFPVEDLLEDETIDGSTLLIESIKAGNLEAAKVLIKIMLFNCTVEELVSYINKTDKYARTVAHYLTHEMDILKSIGNYIDWKRKNSSGQTPLFSIFRSYDQPNYEEMVKTAFDIANTWYRKHNSLFDYLDHTDNKGNSLLHVLKTNIPILLQLTKLDINEENYKGLTPLMVYVKYKRLSNIDAITKDRRLILEKVQNSTFFTCFDYAKDHSVLSKIGERGVKDSLFGLIYFHSLRYHNLNATTNITSVSNAEKPFATTVINMKTIQGLLRSILKDNPFTFLPLNTYIDEISHLNRSDLTIIGKTDVTSLLHQLTNCFNVLLFLKKIPENLFTDEASILYWMRINTSKRNQKPSGKENPKTMEPEEINTIQSFLRFNFDEISSFKASLNILRKVLIFINLKSDDFEDAYKGLNEMGRKLINSEASSAFKGIITNHNMFSELSLAELLENVRFLEQCTIQLSSFVQIILFEKIPNWWKHYGEFLALHKSYRKAFPNMVKPKSASDTSSRAPLGGFIETKREQSEQRLAVQIKASSKMLKELGSEIFVAHERLAEELSNYMEFRKACLDQRSLVAFATTNISVLQECV